MISERESFDLNLLKTHFMSNFIYLFFFHFSLHTCEVRKTEMIQLATREYRFYSELHAKKQNARKQALITKFVRPNPPDVDPSIPGTSGENPTAPRLATVEELFDTSDIEEFEGLLAEIQ